jgi:hypothetical protein
LNQVGFREKLVARLGNAQLSDSKGGNNDSYEVEEQENEDDQSSLMKNSIGAPPNNGNQRHYTHEMINEDNSDD